MKRCTMVRLGAILILAAVFCSCGNANQFGGAFDVTRVCADDTCQDLYNQQDNAISVTGDSYLTVYFELHNRTPESTTGNDQTVRAHRAEMRFTPPAGCPDIPMKTYAFTTNVEPDTKVIQSITVMDNTQIEFIRDRLNLFPDLPFQVDCAVTIFYNTTGGVSGSVERHISIGITT